MKILKFFCLILFSMTLIPYCLYAEEVLVWEDCVTEAKQNNPDLISAQEKVNQSKAVKDITKSAALPQINGDLNASNSKNSSGNNGGSGGTNKSYSYGVTGSQLIFDGLKTYYNIAAAESNITSTQYNYNVISSNIRLGLRSAFIYLLRAQEFLIVAEDIAKRRKQNVDLVTLRYEGGREHRGSLLTAQADLAQALFEVTAAKRAIELAQRRLIKELGRQEKTEISCKGSFVITERSKGMPDFENMAETNPFLKELIAKKESAKYGLSSAKAEFFPQIYANGSAGMNDSNWPPEKNTWSVGLAASLPIFEGGLRFADVAKAKAVLGQASADEKSGRDGVIYTLADTWTKLCDAAENIGVQESYLSATKERAKIAEAEYSNGVMSFDNWIIIEDNLVSAKKRYLDAQANAALVEADWIQAKGGTLDYDEIK